MKARSLLLFAFVFPLIGCNKNNGVIDVANYVDSTGKHDCADLIQQLIKQHPHRTLYFRDGTYLLSHQILTPGDPKYSVDLQLSNYAILKASDDYQVKRTGKIEDWQDEYLYMVSLGGLDRENDVITPGSVYSLTGGIIDGSGIAAGVEIAGGRETRVQNVSMKGVEIGLRIAPGVNGTPPGGSSDADIRDMSIICNDSATSYGLKLEGSDNSATNIRIGHVTHGVYTTGGTNILTNIHPLHNGNCLAKNYDESIGFEIKNFTVLNNCYSDNFRIAYQIDKSAAFLNDCIAWWFEPGGSNLDELAFNKTDAEFNCIVNNFVMGPKDKNKAGDPAHPTIMVADDTSHTGDGSIHNIYARFRDAITDVDETNDYKPLDGSILATYCKDEKIFEYK